MVMMCCLYAFINCHLGWSRKRRIFSIVELDLFQINQLLSTAYIRNSYFASSDHISLVLTSSYRQLFHLALPFMYSRHRSIHNGWLFCSTYNILININKLNSNHLRLIEYAKCTGLHLIGKRIVLFHTIKP